MEPVSELVSGLQAGIFPLVYCLWTSLLFPGHTAYDSTVFLTSRDHELQCNPQRQNSVVQIFKSQQLNIFSDFLKKATLPTINQTILGKLVVC